MLTPTLPRPPVRAPRPVRRPIVAPIRARAPRGAQLTGTARRTLSQRASLAGTAAAAHRNGFSIFTLHIRVKNGGTYAKVWLTSCSGDGCLCSRCFILCLCKHAIYHFPSEMQPQRCNGVWINTICVQYKYKLSSLLSYHTMLSGHLPLVRTEYGRWKLKSVSYMLCLILIYNVPKGLRTRIQLSNETKKEKIG